MKWRLSLAALVLGCAASTAWSQTAIQPGTIVGSFYGLQYFAQSTNVPVYTTPPDRAARVTDIIVTNYHTLSCKGSLRIGLNDLYFAVTPGQSLGDADYVRFAGFFGQPLEFFIPEHRNADHSPIGKQQERNR